MSASVLDCRKMECPQPVVEARKLIAAESPAELEVLVDNDAARENVTRLLGGQGYAVSDSKDADGVWHLLGVKNAACVCEAAEEVLSGNLPNFRDDLRCKLTVLPLRCVLHRVQEHEVHATLHAPARPFVEILGSYLLIACAYRQEA